MKVNQFIRSNVFNNLARAFVFAVLTLSSTLAAAWSFPLKQLADGAPGQQLPVGQDYQFVSPTQYLVYPLDQHIFQDKPVVDATADFRGIVALSNCSGSVVKLPDSRPSDFAMVMTNGHCLEGSFLKPGQIVTNKASQRTMRVFTKTNPALGKITVTSTRILYGAMTKTDVSLYQLRETYEAIETQIGVEAFVLADREPEIGTPMAVPSGYWQKNYSCFVEKMIPLLKEGGYDFQNSIRYTRPGCETIGGTSGSPIIAQGTRTAIGINNTGNESGQKCTMNNPCEVYPDGTVVAEKGVSYGQQTYWILGCFDAQRNFDLTLPTCELAK